MNLQELKEAIESKTVSSQFFIFQYSDTNFLPIQYYREIAKIRNMEIENLAELPGNSISLFERSQSSLQVFLTDRLEKKVTPRNDLVIVCKSIAADVEKTLGQYIVKFPVLESWQIEDYVYSLLDGVDAQLIQKFYSTVGDNIYRIEGELRKLEGCSASEKQFFLSKMLEEGALSDISNYVIFDLSNAILKKDFQKIKTILAEVDNIDVEPTGLLTILCNNFKNIIKVQLANNPTAESTGMSSKQFWAVRYSCGFYTKEKLVRIYSFLTDLDRQLKTGALPASLLVDYTIAKVLTI